MKILQGAGPVHKAVSLSMVFSPSAPCDCTICISFCSRPGWWTLEEAAGAIEAGYANRMMLELSPDRSFGIIAPAFKGNEAHFALEKYSRNGCTFLRKKRCELYGSGLQPLECRVCHHRRRSIGPRCHAAIGKEWRTVKGQALVQRWTEEVKLFEKLK